MNMEEVHILPTEKTPDVLLKPEGIVKIKGRAIDENVTKYPEQIMNWIDDYLVSPVASTEVIIALEYLNSFNTIILTSILRKLALVNQQSKKLVIKWYIENDDEDLLDRGESISSAFDLPIEFIMTDNIKSLY
ncbi:MAG: SiaC family regulatory phosphoprotein [Bacteroidales bacterium]